MTDIKFCLYKKLCEKYDYRGIAFDNNYLYVTVPNRHEIIRYNRCLEELNTYCVSRGYLSICYDNYYNCFWAISKNEKNKIYKLDNYFNEISYIYVKYNSCKHFYIEKIICCNKCELTICGEFGQIKIEKEEKCVYISEENIEKDIYINNCVEFEDCSLYCSGNKSTKWKICDKENHHNYVDYPLHCDYNIIDIANSDYKCTKCKEIYLLVKKLCGSVYIIKLEMCKKEKNICECNSFNPICNCDCDCFDNCTSDCQSITDIIQSIALMEASLSHILNAEGEKIQKILSCANSTCDIIKVNDSVNKTIINISHLEQILYSKLAIAKELYNYKNCKISCDNTVLDTDITSYFKNKFKDIKFN